MWYDFLSIAILAYTTIRGAMKGVLWQLAAIAGLVLCFVFAESISAAAGPYVKLEPPLNNWVVMIGAYLVFSFASFSVARLLTEWLDKIRFGEFNRHLGALFGFVKGVVICLVLTFFVVTVSEDMHEALRHSRTGRVAAIIMDRLHPVMPEQLHDALTRYIDIHKLDAPDIGLRYGDHAHHSGRPNAQGSGEAVEAVLPPELEELLSRVPPDMRTEFREVLRRSLGTSQPQSRDDLLQSLIRALRKVERPEDVTLLRQALQQPPERLIAAVTDWLTGTAAGDAAGGPVGPADPAAAAVPSRREQLLADISAEFSRYALAQKRIREDIEQQLRDVPEAAALSVLEDWWADLVAARPGQPPFLVRDPDPSTTAATTLRVRIERQLARAVPPVIGGEQIR